MGGKEGKGEGRVGRSGRHCDGGLALTSCALARSVIVLCQLLQEGFNKGERRGRGERGGGEARRATQLKGKTKGKDSASLPCFCTNINHVLGA